MARSKYQPETLDVIYKVLELTGSDSAACEAAKVSRASFYDWLTKYPDFAERVADIKATRLRQGQEQAIDRIVLAEDFITKVLKGEKFKITRQEAFNSQGQIVTLVKEEEIIPTPQMLERVLGQTQADMKVEVSFGITTPEDDG
ncbi:MAG: hypothetical protein KME13_18535 [Myxacorys californica WJT36-NPBG1]|jgi:CRP-like cAMP-binding protein|nr:hypothetical protein [Myxacorys californica WJT36-NPBG1]